MNKKIIATVGACALCLGLGVAGTLAWLTDTTGEVKNTFTTSDINITLTETESNVDNDGSPNTNSYQMIPGFTITKDPKVTVIAGSEDCYLFVKLEKSDNYDSYLENYAMATKIEDGEETSVWTQLLDAKNSPVPGVFYKEVTTNDENQEFQVLKDDQLTVKESVTKEMMDAIDDTSNTTSEPTLTVKAYATQLYETNGKKMDVYTAWTVVSES